MDYSLLWQITKQEKMRGSCLVLALLLLPLLSQVWADYVPAGWKSLENGTYVRVFDDQQAFEGSGNGDTLVDDDDDENKDDNWWNPDDEDSFESSGDTESLSPVALVIPVEASVNFDLPTKQVNLDALNCRLKDGTRVSCVQVSARLRYSGISLPNRIGFKLEYYLDARKQNKKRMFLLGDEGKSSRTGTIYLEKYVEWKESFMVYMLESPHDKLTSIDIWMKYSLDNSSSSFPFSGISVTPVLDEGDHLETDSLSIQKFCGLDNICIPDLSVSTRR